MGTIVVSATRAVFNCACVHKLRKVRIRGTRRFYLVRALLIRGNVQTHLGGGGGALLLGRALLIGTLRYWSILVQVICLVTCLAPSHSYTNAGLFQIGLSATNFSEIWIKMQEFPLMKNIFGNFVTDEGILMTDLGLVELRIFTINNWCDGFQILMVNMMFNMKPLS